MISDVNRTRRIRWCTIVRTWTQDHWSRIVFSDESRFNIGFNEGRICVWRQNGEAIDPGNIAQVRRQGSSSVMVWGCITYEGVGELVVVDGNLNAVGYIEVLEQNLLQSIDNYYLGDRNMHFLF